MSTTAPTRERTEQHDEVTEPDVPWVVIVWNDPVNLMSYVVFVLQKLFGYDREKATRLMLDVHHKGKAVVSSGPREKAEFDVYRLHGHGCGRPCRRTGSPLAGSFKRIGADRVRVRLGHDEVAVLRGLPDQLRTVLGEGEDEPVNQRLFPRPTWTWSTSSTTPSTTA